MTHGLASSADFNRSDMSWNDMKCRGLSLHWPCLACLTKPPHLPIFWKWTFADTLIQKSTVKLGNIPGFVSGHFKLPSGVQAHLVDVEVIYLCHQCFIIYNAFVFLHVAKHIQDKHAQTATNRRAVVKQPVWIFGNFTARFVQFLATNPKDSYLLHSLGSKRFKNIGQRY